MIRTRAEPCVRVVPRALQRGAVGDRKAPNGAEYDHRFVASTEQVASDQGIIVADAWLPGLPAYLRRPRWIASHDIGGWNGLTQAALGRAVHAAVESGLPTAQVGASERALVLYVKYASTPFAQEVKTLYDEGGLDDVSVRWDWRTEVQRAPYQEEVEKYGEDLKWIATRTDLIELSAVMLGADPGAQVVRQGVVEAFERCRSKGLALPHVEKLCRGGACVPGWREPEPAATANTIDDLQRGSGALSEWLDSLAPIRQQIADAVVALQNLTAAATADGEDEEPEESAVALGELSAALTSFDLAARDLGPAVGDVDATVKAVAKAAGVPADRAVVIDWDAILRDVQRRPARKPAGVERIVVGDRTYEVDVAAVRADLARRR